MSSQEEWRLVPLPFATFGELLAFGLEVRAWCTGCKSMRRVEIGVRRLRQPFVGDGSGWTTSLAPCWLA
jgi:hypothetical protein